MCLCQRQDDWDRPGGGWITLAELEEWREKFEELKASAAPGEAKEIHIPANYRKQVMEEKFRDLAHQAGLY